MANLPLLRKWMKIFHPEGIPWPASIFYNRISATRTFKKHYEWVADDIVERMTRGSLLDVGTGPGRLLLTLHEKAPQMRLVGIDVSSGMVDQAQKNMAPRGLGTQIEILEANVEHLPFPDATFDMVVSTGTIHHWKQPSVGLNEIYRVLRPGGQAMMYDLVSDTPRAIFLEMKKLFGRLGATIFWLHSFEEPFYSREEFGKLADGTSFRNEGTEFRGFLCRLSLTKP